MLYDVVWCRKQHGWWPACIIPSKDLPIRYRLPQPTDEPQYIVRYFNDLEPKTFACVSAAHVLPFEPHQAEAAFARDSLPDKRMHAAICNAATYFVIRNSACEALALQTFENARSAATFEAISRNEPLPGVAYQYIDDWGTVSRCSSDTSSASAAPSSASTLTTLQAPRSAVKPRVAAEVCGRAIRLLADGNPRKCQCKTPTSVSGGEPRTCHPSRCANALSHVECCNRNCRANPPEACLNRRLQQLSQGTHTDATNLKVIVCRSKGKGLAATVAFAAGTYILEYVGEIICNSEQRRREEQMRANQHEPKYFFVALDANRVIDAQFKGNLSRFANHSCDPNAQIAKVWWRGDVHLVLQATRRIEANEEVTYDYQWDVKGDNPMVCRCETTKCSGIIGMKRQRHVIVKHADTVCSGLQRRKRVRNTSPRKP